MIILSINSVPYGSTCNIMTGIATIARENNTVTVATGYSTHPVPFSVPHIKIGGIIDKSVHMYLARFTGNNACFSVHNTKRFLKQIDQICPDIIHLHNLHGWFINLPMLFEYIKNHNIPVIWTLHDCWSFTGHCPHFTMVKCDRWKTGCHNCPQYREYPESYVDNSALMYAKKKKWFTGVKNLTIVTPSHWLADLVKESYLKDYPVKVIHNGIDLDVFKPTPSNFRQKNGIDDGKHIILGVAFGWGKRKGLDVFVELSERLDSEEYQIVLVGTDDSVDKQLSSNIISIHRTQDQKELAEIYTAADVFVNPTREENYPTVNMEALACGTPVITFKTGGSPEIINDSCGISVDCDDVAMLEKKIRQVCVRKTFDAKSCLNRASDFDRNNRLKEYVDLYMTYRFE